MLNDRYPNCSSFNVQLSNVWSNFYKIKKDVLNPVKSRSDTTASYVKILNDTFINKINPLFKGVKDRLYSTSE